MGLNSGNEKKIPRKSALSRFKAKQLVVLKEIEKELITKYINDPVKLKEVIETIRNLELKIRELRTRGLYNYITLLIMLSKEYPEFRKMIPSQDEIP